MSRKIFKLILATDSFFYVMPNFVWFVEIVYQSFEIMEQQCVTVV